MATQVTEAPSEIQSVNFVKDVLIEAPVEITWEAVLAETQRMLAGTSPLVQWRARVLKEIEDVLSL